MIEMIELKIKKTNFTDKDGKEELEYEKNIQIEAEELLSDIIVDKVIKKMNM